MSEAAQHHAINYVEFSTTDMTRAKRFYGAVFGWSFQDYGPEYIAFYKAGAGIDGGFHTREAGQETGHGAPLVVLYSKDLRLRRMRLLRREERLWCRRLSSRADGGFISRMVRGMCWRCGRSEGSGQWSVISYQWDAE